jgi:hypothetical protein
MLTQVLLPPPRWCDTYLLPEEPLPDSLAAAFGAAGAGLNVAGMLVQVATTCLTAYPGETELHTQVGRQRGLACIALIGRGASTV